MRTVEELASREAQAIAKYTQPSDYNNHAHEDSADEGDTYNFTDWPSGRIDGYFDVEPPPVPWFCNERLLAGRGHLLAGIGGSSKTRLLYHLAIGAVLGTLPWSWAVNATGSAALFLTEDVAAQVHRVLFQLGHHLNPEQRALLERRLRIFPLAGKQATLLRLHGGALQVGPVYGWMMDQLDDVISPLVFVGIDPARRVTEGDEMNQAHQYRLGQLIDEMAVNTGACTMLASHAAKGMHQLEEVPSHMARGAGSITDAVRGEYVLRNMTANEATRFGITDPLDRRRYLQMVGTKGNELPPEAFVPVWLRRGIGGALEEVTLAATTNNGIGTRERDALAILQRECALGVEYPLRTWRARCIEAGLISRTATPGAQEKAMERIRDALEAASLVRNGSSRGYWLPTMPDNQPTDDNP